jgi:uncharacterized protein (TIGR02452 family)
MASRKHREAVARDTVTIFDRGDYARADGTTISIADSLARAKAGTKLYRPDDFGADDFAPSFDPSATTEFRVTNRTTLAAARAILEERPDANPVCLNFASAKNPGGGFLNGSQAQEESLARASGLYACIEPVRGYYDANRNCGTALYTDHAIYSPGVPVFRDDEDALLDAPYETAMITAPAVNAGAILHYESHDAERIEPVQSRRTERILAVAARHGHRTLVLGAWGCGVFRNSPETIARLFHEHLTANARFRGAFDLVEFAVLDFSADRATYEAFRRRFAGVAST